MLSSVKLREINLETRVIPRCIHKLLGSRLYYVRIRPRLLTVREAVSRKTVEDIPFLAVDHDSDPVKILEVGAIAASTAAQSGGNVDLVNGFDHPRSIISDFTLAEKTLQHFFLKLYDDAFLKPSPIVIMHPLEKIEGGLTQIEVRALQELAMGAGAREAHVWKGRELMDYELESRSFPQEGWASAKPKWDK